MTSVLREDLGQDLAMMARLVQSQLIRGMTAFFQRDPRLAEQVTQKDDQVDNLLGLIEVKCFERIAETAPNDVRSRQLRGVFRVALNLESSATTPSTSPSRRSTCRVWPRARSRSISPVRRAWR